MSIRKGKWTSYPNDEQIRREANREYWKFICPECDSGGTCGHVVGGKTVCVKCYSCGWEWNDPLANIQTTLQEFSQ